jgi:hypothetical protein
MFKSHQIKSNHRVLWKNEVDAYGARWVIVKVSRMQYTELNSWVTSLKDAHVCARKIADVLIEKTYIDFRYFLCFEANYCYNFLRGES